MKQIKTLRKRPLKKKRPSIMTPAGRWQQIDRCYANRLFNNFHLHFRKPFEAANQNIAVPSNFWFEADFIHHLAKRIIDNDYSGIRIYFGAYDKDMGLRTDTKYESAPTIFIVETKFENNMHVDQFSDTCVETAFYDGYNHGHLCPPDPAEQCKGAEFKTEDVP